MRFFFQSLSVSKYQSFRLEIKINAYLKQRIKLQLKFSLERFKRGICLENDFLLLLNLFFIFEKLILNFIQLSTFFVVNFILENYKRRYFSMGKFLYFFLKSFD